MARREKQEQLVDHLDRLADSIRDVEPSDAHAALVGRFFQLVVLLQSEDLIPGNTTWGLTPRKPRAASEAKSRA